MKKQGKKRALVLVAMVVLLAVVLGMGGTTFAKYITVEQVPTQQATVAKWGYVVTANIENMFGSDYTKGTGDYSTIVDAGTGIAVKSASDPQVNVVAPGTSGSMTLAINGKAEVLSKINVAVDAQAIQLTALTPSAKATSVSPITSPNVYEPIVWAVTTGDPGNDDKVDGKDIISAWETANSGKDADALTMAEMKSLLVSISKTSVPANTEYAINLTITWKWAFGGAADTITQEDYYDTILGNAIANSKTTWTTATGNTVVDSYSEATAGTAVTQMSLDIKVTIQQIQAA